MLPPRQLRAALKHEELIKETKTNSKPTPKSRWPTGHLHCFTGPSGRIADKKDFADHAKSVEIGVRRAKELIANCAGKPGRKSLLK
jgi:hypothetical protein